MSETIRVLCVDHQPIMREGLAVVIGREPDMRVVATPADGVHGVATWERLRPDVTLIDLQLPRMDGMAALRAIRARDAGARVLIFTAYHGDEDIRAALNAGASAYLLKDTPAADLIVAVRKVHRGYYALSPDTQVLLAMHARDPHLTTREVQVLKLVAIGSRNRDIGLELGISNETVHVHLRNIFAKLSVSDRTEAVFVANQRGIVHLNAPLDPQHL